MAVEVVNLSPYSVISIWTLHTAISSVRIAVGLLECNVPRLLNCLLDTFFCTFPYMSLTGVCLVTYMPIPPKLSGYYKQFLFNRSALNNELHHSPRPWSQPRVTQEVASCNHAVTSLGENKVIKHPLPHTSFCKTQWHHSVRTRLYKNLPSYFIVLASSVKTKEVEVIEFHRFDLFPLG